MKMKQEFSTKLTIATLLVCVLYAAISLLNSIESIQQKNAGRLGGDARAAYECPAGYEEIADFCIQSSLQGDKNWHDAVKDCAEDEDARLCKSHELMAACLAEDIDGKSFDDDIDNGGWEWSADMADDNEVAAMFGNDNNCRGMDLKNMNSNDYDYRCCKNRY